MPATCTHVAIHARDVERSVEFYRRYAGLVEVHRRVDGAVTVVWLGEPGHERRFVIVLLGLDHAGAAEPAPMAHIGYAVDSREEVDRLAALGSAAGVLAAGPVDAGPIVGYFCVVRDPDGNWVEFSHGQSLGDHA
jgi:catechol 2,3-dioxygenase-like lactoylglutathione lyase family enzyme